MNYKDSKNIFETNFIPNHYYPYNIHFNNLFSFQYINDLISPSILVLFSISKIRGYSKIKYTAIYNIEEHYYLFDDKRFISYENLLNYVYNFH